MLACGAVALLSVIQGNYVLAILMFGLLGSLTGFLFYNFHPARIFMGDCGSLFLGFIIAGATLIMSSKTKSLIGVGLPILVLSIPIFDTLFSMLRRFLERRGLMSPDNGHFHHRLMERGFKQHEVALSAYAVTIAISGLGMFMLVTRGADSILLFGICLVLVVLVFRAAGAVRLIDTVQGLRGRSELFRLQNKERKIFEEAQLQFRRAQDHEEWWQCMCRAATAMDFASASLELTKRDHETRILIWNNSKYPESDAQNSTLRINIPMQDRRKGSISNFSVEIPTNKSLESAGRKAALLARLTEENGLDSLVAGNELTRDTGSQTLPTVSPAASKMSSNPSKRVAGHVLPRNLKRGALS
jgi:UDP-GlcNAc:undecaprenyl-phosphate GlcNAc-1-phosphate transferase